MHIPPPPYLYRSPTNNEKSYFLSDTQNTILAGTQTLPTQCAALDVDPTATTPDIAAATLAANCAVGQKQKARVPKKEMTTKKRAVQTKKNARQRVPS
jgi:hypothetical protein